VFPSNTDNFGRLKLSLAYSYRLETYPSIVFNEFLIEDFTVEEDAKACYLVLSLLLTDLRRG
jgi:hypothetical protein